MELADKNKKDEKNAGFALFEAIIVLLILAILSAVPIANFVFFQKNADLDNCVQNFVSVLRLAQSKTMASHLDSQYGIYLNALSSPNQFILFKGASYASRDAAFDEQHNLPAKIEFDGASLEDGNEIIFDKITGAPEAQKNISFQIKNDASRNKTVYIASSGAISFSQPASPSDAGRISDARHLTFDYSRYIDTLTENLVLTFDGSIIEQIPISQNMATGQFEWTGSVNVGGADQTIYIRTYRINSTDTEFSVFRDRRYNNKSLSIALSGDSSGSLVYYPETGLTADFSSVYVSNFNIR